MIDLLNKMKDAGVTPYLLILLTGAITFLTMAIFENRAVAELSHDLAITNTEKIGALNTREDERLHRVLDKIEDLKKQQDRIENKVDKLMEYK